MDYVKAQVEIVSDMLKQDYPKVFSADVDPDHLFLTVDGYHGFVFQKNEIVVGRSLIGDMTVKLDFKGVYDRGIVLEPTGDLKKTGKRTAVVYKSSYGDEIHLDKKFLKHFKGCDFLYSGGPRHKVYHAVYAYDRGEPAGLVLPLIGGSLAKKEVKE